LESWIAGNIILNLDVKKYGDENAVKFLVGNKIDLEDKREVTFEEGKQLADSLNIGFIGIHDYNLETSAKTSSNVQEVFISLA
jgi:Ras-related protein Rab-1A